ncbi:MAG: GDP-L-fucose synthase [Dysgonamonadaceae bacterium]|jgi:GDP-L-fucose synthase|nr:GDP-L-fucose synthase [Dysgonamonadaceae bacterium]
MERSAKIFVAGHRGLVGSAILKNLQSKGYHHLLVKSSSELDLSDQRTTASFFQREKPEYVFLAAAKVGGIVANNTYRAQFIYENLMIQNNVIHAAFLSGVKKLLFLGSTCIYPKETLQPMPEDCLLTSPLEYTNEPYAIAKIAGIKMCESYNLQYGTNFIAVMPTNLYGPNDNFDLEKSHVLPALLRKIYLGKCWFSGDWEAIRQDLDKRPIADINSLSSQQEIGAMLNRFGISENRVEIWGTGAPLREFLWSEEMADASVYIMEQVDFKDLIPPGKEIRNTHINIGTGEELSIKALATLIAQSVGYTGELYFNSEKPDGTMRKLTDVNKLHHLGWHHQINIQEGVKKLYQWYLEN